MRLDVIVPTYNRHTLLDNTLRSLWRAGVPQGLDVHVTVVDNNSKDRTPEVVEQWQPKFAGRLQYLFERQQGRSAALNAGICATNGDLVGMIDDDEEIDAGWYERVHAAFSEGRIDFIGGPYVPRWGARPPDWLPMNYVGVIGWIDGGEQVVTYGKDYPGILMGGNAVLTRAILDRVGLYLTSLSRTGKRLLAGEDEDMYARLLAAGARGVYLPDLIIHHYVPPERLTKQYFRRWCFWRGVSRGILNKVQRSPEAHLSGVPRRLYGDAARSLLRIGARTVKRRREPAAHFSDELAVWDLAGFFYGKHLYRAAM
ncbi:MAG: glucosyl-dolichyl phosphate glucuronosyltransferase [Blastocatellia bacterium]